MKRVHRTSMAIAVALALGSLAPLAPAQTFTWSTVVNNGMYVPPCGAVPGGAKLFNSYSQPSVNEQGVVAFRGRSKGTDGGSGEGEDTAALVDAEAAAAAGEPARGVFSRDTRSGGPITTVACVGGAVPQPSNTDFNGAPASFNEFPAFPRIDAQSPSIATRGQSLPVWVYPIGVDLTTQVGTSGVYTNPGGVLTTGASLLGAVVEFPATTLKFPQYSVPGAAPGTRFDQFPGAAAIVNGTTIAYKGNYTEGGIGRTGVFFRDVSRADNPTYLVANSLTPIPNQPAGGATNFGSTAPPSAAGAYLHFVGSDIEEAPTLGGIYRAKMKDKESQKLETLVGIGAQVPGEAAGTGFRMFGEGLSVSSDANYVSFWGTWGTEATSKTLYCPLDGNADLIAYCNATYPSGFVVSIPVHQGIFVFDGKKKEVVAISRSGEDGMQDYLFWVFSGAPPGVGGTEDTTREPPRWRSSAFAAVSLTARKNYAVAFKATQAGIPGVFLRKGTTPLQTVVKMFSPGRAIDALAPANSIVTAVGIERDGFRGANLAITASMLYETIEESIGWAGIYMTQVPLAD